MKGKTLFMFVVLALASWTSIAQAKDIQVPGDWDEIDDAILVATAGVDKVVVVDDGTYDPFILNKAIEVTTTAENVIIDGDRTSADYAAIITVPGGRITGSFTFTGGTQAVVTLDGGRLENCLIDVDGGDTGIDISESEVGTASVLGVTIRNFNVAGVIVTGSQQERPLIQDCLIEDGEVGVWVTYGVAADIKGNTIKTDDAGIRFLNGKYSEILNNYIEESQEVGEYGIDIHAAGFAGGPIISGNTIIGFDTGLIVDGVLDSVTVLSNLVSGSRDFGIDCANLNVILEDNDSWGNGTNTVGENYRNCGSTPLDENISADPLFCDEREGLTAEHTLRIDSPCAEGVYGTQIGALGVECAWDTLSADTIIPEGAEIYVLADVTVPDGISLTVEKGAVLKFDEDDESPGGGSDTDENELIVASGGSLDINGAAGVDKVTFQSAEDNPYEGDWYGIHVKSGGEATIDYADIQHAQYGILFQSSEAGSIKNCSFENNELSDIYAGASSTDMDLAIESNTITVGGGKGIKLLSVVNGVDVDGNTITGDEESSAGIYVGLFTGDDTPVIQNNPIREVWYGPGIHNAGDCDARIQGNTIEDCDPGIEVSNGVPVILGNDITDCWFGIEVTGGSPLIGDDGVNEDNTITGISTGILLSSTETSVVRNNTITSCFFGGIRVTAGSPQIGLHDDEGSDNILTENTIGLNVLNSSTPVVRNNQFLDNTYGVSANTGGNPNLGNESEDGENTFLDSDTYCIRNLNSSVTVLAHGNYFGECTGGEFDPCTSGDVETDDHLCTEPAGVVMDIVELSKEPGGLRVLGTRPHPLRGPGQIYFSLEEGRGQVEIQVFDVAGRLVRSFGAFEAAPGENYVRWDGTGSDGSPIGSGMYFIRIVTDNRLHDTAKLLVVR